MAVECEGERELGGRSAECDLFCTLFFEKEECGGVGEGIDAGGDGYVVAAEFALLTEAGADPPDGGVEEEESLDHGLEDVPEIVGAADVSELVGEDGFELLGREGGEGGGGQQDERANHSDGERAGDAGGET